MKQLTFDYAATSARDAGIVLYYAGLPDRSGLTAYTHLIRHPSDAARESRESRRERAGEDASTEWKATTGGTVASWVERIEQLMADGEPRTFNAICLELTGGRMTADVCGGKAPDVALWALVESTRLRWGCADGVVLFIHESAVTACACAECSAKEAA